MRASFLRAFIVISCIWRGADCFSWKPSTSLPLVTHCDKTTRLANSHHRHYRQLFAEKQVKMISPEVRGQATINVVEGPFQGQFGLWFVDSHDAQVFSLVFVCDVDIVVPLTFLSGSFGLSYVIAGSCNFTFLRNFGCPYFIINAELDG